MLIKILPLENSGTTCKNSEDPDQMSHDVASDLSLHFLLYHLRGFQNKIG